MKRLEATEAALRHMLAQAIAAAVEYGANPNQWSYSSMMRAKAIFYGSMLIRLRSDAHAGEDFAEAAPRREKPAVDPDWFLVSPHPAE